MSAADDHRNGDCWGDDRCPVCAADDAVRLGRLAGSPAGTRVVDRDGDVWEHLGDDEWAGAEGPVRYPIDHIDSTWGPVEKVSPDLARRPHPDVRRSWRP